MDRGQTDNRTGPAEMIGGRRVPPLSLAVIVSAGLEVGLDRLTVARVAQRLDVSSAALYRHVGGRDDLVAAIGEHLMSEFSAPPDSGQPWPDYLQELGELLRRFVHHHPGIGLHLMRLRASSTESLRVIEQCDAVLVSRGLIPLDAVGLAGTVASFSIGAAETERLAMEVAVDGRAHARFYDGIAQHAGDLPVLAAATAARRAPTDPDHYYSWKLGCLIDGLVRSHQRGTLPWHRA